MEYPKDGNINLQEAVRDLNARIVKLEPKVTPIGPNVPAVTTSSPEWMQQLKAQKKA